MRATVRAEAEQLEHAVLRHRHGGLPGDELGAESARPGRGRRVAPAAAARVAERHGGGVARADEIDRSGGGPKSARRARGTRIWRVLRGGGAPRPGRGRLVAYEALPAAVWDIGGAALFALRSTARQRAGIAQAARMHAKAPLGTAAEFVPDAAAKQAAASAELRRAIDLFARPQLERLVRLHADGDRRRSCRAPSRRRARIPPAVPARACPWRAPRDARAVRHRGSAP